MNKQNIIVGLLFVVLLTLNFTIKPYLRQRDTVRIIETVLTHWENGDLTLAMPYWEHEVDSPPVYNLLAYEVGKGKVSRNNGRYSAQIIATLNFPPGNPLPSGKKWIFELIKTRYGWKITDFHILRN